MIIKKISVSADYCFGPEPLELKELGKVNFIFASNGSGKTTISKALSRQPKDIAARKSWSVAPTDLSVRVFNEEYRSKVLTEHVAGIFSIGENSKEIEGRISVLESKKAALNLDIENWKKEIEGTDKLGNAIGLRPDIQRTKEEVSNSIFEAYKNTPKEVSQLVFSGYRRSKNKLFDEAFRRYLNNPQTESSDSWETLNKRAVVLQGSGKIRPLLPQLSVTEVVKNDDMSVVARSFTPRNTGKFSSLIENLSNQDWVNKGRQYLNRSEEVCPFCQQPVGLDFAKELNEYFANEFDSFFDEVKRIGEYAKSEADHLEGELSNLLRMVDRDKEIDDSIFLRAVSSVRKSVNLLLSDLREKYDHPTRAVQLTNITDGINELTELIAKENERISEYNRAVSDVENEKQKLASDGWMLFLSSPEVLNQLKRYNGVIKKKEQRIDELEAAISVNQKEVKDVDEEISTLRSSYSNTSEVASKINKLLAAVGFSRFRLGVADHEKGSYHIVRENGVPAFDSLSEGERSFICFAYFWESLFGSDASGGVPEDIVAVIDDPISSMDSDVLFIVSQFIREAAIDIIEDKSNLRQLIILTHNTQFHREAAYSNDRNSSDRRYFRLIKNLNGFTSVRADGGESKIRGTYALLWDAVVEAARDDSDSALVHVGVCNVVRRIVEWYFKTVGDIKNYRRPSGLLPVEEKIMTTFHVWANAGSHTITDDVDQTIGISETKRFLTLFEMYFDVQGHGAHFDMMIEASGGGDLLSEGGLFSRGSR